MTPPRIVVWEAFWLDLADGAAWYNDQEPGVGVQFEEAVFLQLASIRDRPESFPTWRGIVRRATMKRFPYSIAFIIESDTTQILGLVHGKRDLPKWIERRVNE